MVVQTEDIDLAGEIVQDAAAYLGLTELASTASFPALMQSFQAVLVKVKAMPSFSTLPTNACSAMPAEPCLSKRAFCCKFLHLQKLSASGHDEVPWLCSDSGRLDTQTLW